MTKRDSTPSEHPTLVPLYDVEKAARDAVSIPPDTARSAFREQMPTYTDPVELEAARVKSTFTVPPPSGPVSSAPSPSVAPPSGPVLEVLPEEVVEVLSEEAAETEYQRRLGSFDRVPVVVLAPEALTALALDGRASMLLALLDGRSSIGAILDIGMLNELDTLAGLVDLLDRGVIILLG